jgi:hypothetical protein
VRDRILSRFGSLFHFEMPGDPTGGAPAEPVGEPVEPAWTGPSQEDWQGVQQTLGYLAQQFQQPQEQQGYGQQGQQGQQLPPIDFFAENATEQLMDVFGQMLDQRLTPFQEFQYGQQIGEAEERALDIIDDDIAQNGEFLNPDKATPFARALANVYYPEEAARKGEGPQAAEAAIRRACADTRAYEQEVGKAYYDRQINQLTRLDGAGREPMGASVGASSGFKVGPGGDELSVVTGFGGFPGRS